MIHMVININWSIWWWSIWWLILICKHGSVISHGFVVSMWNVIGLMVRISHGFTNHVNLYMVSQTMWNLDGFANHVNLICGTEYIIWDTVLLLVLLVKDLRHRHGTHGQPWTIKAQDPIRCRKQGPCCAAKRAPNCTSKGTLLRGRSAREDSWSTGTNIPEKSEQ